MEIMGTRSEYNAISREHSGVILMGLAALIQVLGVLLAIALPWSFLDFMASEQLLNANPMYQIFFAFLGILSFLLIGRWCIVSLFALRASRQRRQNVELPLSGWPSVSILVPAYQEAENIESALRSLVELDYPNFEIIVVDDGSSDDTFAKAQKFEGRFSRGTVRVLRKRNGGKWSALNFAFQHATGEFILCIDADSRLSWDALRLLVARMSSPEVVAVSGQVTVRNRTNLISRLQALEYVVANGGLRTAQSYFGSVLVVPGPIGLYRREILEQIAAQEKASGTHLAEGAVPGPLSGETFAEDFQLSLSALSLNGRIVYEPRAIAYTRAPDRTYQLINQRYRWLRGSMQVLDIYRKRLRSKSQPSTRQKIDTILICLYAFDIYILPLLNFVVLVGMLATIAHVSFPGEVLSWLLAILLLNFASSAYCVLTQNDDPSLLINVPALEVYQNILINSAWIMAAVDQLRRSRMHW